MARRTRKNRVRIDAKQILLALLGIGLAALVIFVAGYHLGMKLDAPTMLTSSNEVEPTAAKTMTAGLSGSALENFSFFDELDEPAARTKVRRLQKGNANNVLRNKKDRLEVRAERRAAKANRQRSARKMERKSQRLRRVVRTPPQKPALPQTSRQVAGTVARALESAPARERDPVVKEASAAAQYTVQVASFGSFDESSALVRKLRGQGLPARVVLGRSASGKIYRVRVGRFESRDDAANKLGTLRSNGLKPVITKL